MKYLLAIYSDEAHWAAMSEAEAREVMSEFMKFTKDIHQSGHYLGGNALQPTSTATSVRVRDGKTLATDGPFAETREQLGGFIVIEARDLDDALQVASRIPPARLGCVEVRPIQELRRRDRAADAQGAPT